MLSILVPHVTPRISYTMDLLFGQILLLPYQILSSVETLPEGPLVNYSAQHAGQGVSIPNLGLLEESDIRPQYPVIRHAAIPHLFATEDTGTDLTFDLFSAVFFLVSEYEKYLEPPLDAHQRYDASKLLSAELSLDRLPLVHLYALYLWRKLQGAYRGKDLPGLPSPQFDFRITIDVDNPWKYLHKGVGIALGGAGKDVLHGRWGQLLERIRTHFNKKDPYDTFDELFVLCPPDKTQFFFLLDRHSPFDSRFFPKTPAYRHLMQEIRRKGYRCGIHPSYTTPLNPSRLNSEKEALEAVLGEEITHSRQHFLRYKLPETFRSLQAMGIRDEFSSCLFQSGGFPAGMAQPYPWFDLEKNEQTDLMLWPTHIMDRSLEQYLGLSPDQALDHFQTIVNGCRIVGGTFVLLIHNDALSESEEWKGWSQTIRSMISYLTNL
ncbi:MAG: polysaccharide deacetylase family protein [Bacteroidota bacterium]